MARPRTEVCHWSGSSFAEIIAPVRQRDADLVDTIFLRQRKDPVAAAEAAPQTAQVRAIGFVRRDSGTRSKAFDIQLRKCPRNVGEEPGPFGSLRRAEKLDRCYELGVPAVDRWIGLVRTMEEKGLR